MVQTVVLPFSTRPHNAALATTCLIPGVQLGHAAKLVVIESEARDLLADILHLNGMVSSAKWGRFGT